MYTTFTGLAAGPKFAQTADLRFVVKNTGRSNFCNLTKPVRWG